MPTTDPDARADSGLPGSYCSLRWRHSQVDVRHGKTRACCKTPYVKVSGEEIATLGTRAVFNNKHFVDRRREMLAGVMHPDCEVCWRHERLGLPSYRQVESRKPQFSTPATPEDAAAEASSAFPSQMELILSTLCDLACVYCDPSFSSAWAAEARAFGLQPGADIVSSASDSDPAFEETFWRWYRSCLPHLEYLQFNGGEPLLQKEFYQAIDALLASGVGGLRVGLVTNLNTPAAQFSRFLSYVPELVARFDLRVGISQEATCRRAEYIRHGLRWERFCRNLEELIQQLNGKPVTLYCTLSALSVIRFPDYVAFVLALSERHGVDFQWVTNLVTLPVGLDPVLVGDAGADGLHEAARRLETAGRWPDLQAWLRGAAAAMRDGNALVPSRETQRAAFRRYVGGLDRRRGLDARSVFPELAQLLDAP